MPQTQIPTKPEPLDLDNLSVTRTINFTVADASQRLPEMEARLGELRGRKDTYRSELVRFAVRHLYTHPELLEELASNPV